MIKKTAVASRFLTPVLAEDLWCGFHRTRSDELAYVPRPDRTRDVDEECNDETDPPQ